VLGESVLAATLAVQVALDAGLATAELIVAAGCGLVVVFGMWWVYFAQPAERILVSNRVSFLWGYGHYWIFSSAAAVGAGLLVTVDHVTGVAHVTGTGAGYTVAMPLAVFLLAVWLLHVRPQRRGTVQDAAFLGTAALVLLAPLTGVALPAIAAVLAGLVAVCVATTGGSDGSRPVTEPGV
jgi:low temperature requirement protein LtrA